MGIEDGLKSIDDMGLQSLDGEQESQDLHIRVKKTITPHMKRRVFSEIALEKELPWHFENGVAYHCISWGDVDALTYLRVIVKQQKLEYALISTWCMAKTDIEEVFDWIDKGYIGRVDFFVGEIFKGSYAAEYALLTAGCKTRGCKVVVFRNHSKIILAFGERFDAAIELSANVNTNPRTEQACITIDSELAEWYKDIFDGISPFNRDFKQPPNHKLERVR